MYFPFALIKFYFYPRILVPAKQTFISSHVTKKATQLLGTATQEVVTKSLAFFLTLSQNMYSTLSLFLELSIAKYFSVTKQKRGRASFSSNRLINRKKALLFLPKLPKIQNLSKTIGGLFHAWFWFDTLTQAVVTPVSKGFSRLQIENLRNKYSLFTWHLTSAHEGFWIRQTVMMVLSGSVLFQTWLVRLPFLSVLVETHSSMTLPAWV